MTVRRTEAMTFVFTDIEGSTRRWETDPEAIREALVTHDRVLRTTIEQHDGVVFKHTGDGVCAVFELATDAVAAAIEAQRQLELPVRMGIATGSADERDGDYFGPVLNRAARVMGAGHGGQILLADSTSAIVDTDAYIDLGVHSLPDLGTPIRLTQVVADGLRIEFPPLRTVRGVLGNVVAPSAPLIGRSGDLAQIVERVERHRLVTLTGPGGVGKTRLATDIASTLASRYAHGAWLIELASIGGTDDVASLVATVLGVTVGPTEPLESVVDALKGREVLLVFDNCEHVTDATHRVVSRLLERTEAVSVLATSRQAIGVTGEQLWPVPPLDVDSGSESAAVSLFVERALAADPSFLVDITSADLDIVLQICRDLDGLALAIELAAARMVSMSPREVAARLDDRLKALGAAPRGAPHQRTLRTTVAWSYDLLDDRERWLFDRCAVFAGGFDLASLLAVCEVDDGDGDEYAVFDLLDSLVRRSLIVADLTRVDTRYRMLETIRQFGDEQLERSGSTESVRRAHAAYFGRRAQEMWDVWNSPAHSDAVEWVDAQLAELRKAFRWAVASGEIEVAACVASHTAMLSFVLLRFEPVGWVDEVIADAAAADIDQLPRLYTAASIRGLTGGKQLAVHAAVEAVRLSRDPKYDAFENGWTRYWEAIGRRYADQLDRYIEICRELAAEPGYSSVIGKCGLLGVLAGVGRHDEALALSDPALHAAHTLGNPFWIAYAMASWARAHASSDRNAAVDMLADVLEYTSVHRNDFVRSVAMREMAALQQTDGDVPAALENFATVIEWYRETGTRGSVATTLGEIVVMLDRLELHEKAAVVSGMIGRYGESIAEYLPAAIEHLHAVLGDERFSACAAEGAAMEFDDAMVYVGRLLESANAEAASDT